MTEGQRIKYLRKEKLGLTLAKFSKALGVAVSTISEIENGRNALSNQMIMLIRNEYNVNEEWLRSGEGDVFKQLDDEGRVAEVEEHIIDLDTNSDEFKLHEKLMKLSEEDITKLLQIAEILAK